MQEREILFRGKRKDNGEWVYGDLLREKDIFGEIRTRIFVVTGKGNYTKEEVIPETRGEYTGLTDKNGVKIFEGDIVSNEWCLISGNSVVKFGEYRDFHMSKEYQQGHYGFYLEHLDPSEEAITRKDMMYFANRCEVIGNIHDNPELLEVK